MKLGIVSHIGKTMLFRLVLYFIIIILITLLTSSYFIYNYFSSSFKNEITDFNNKVLNQVSIFSDDFLLKNINEQSLHIVLGNSISPYVKQMMEENITGRSEIALYAYKELDQMVFQNRDIMYSILLHSKKNNLLVSSKFIAQVNEKNSDYSEELELIRDFYSSGQSIAWYPTRRAKIYSTVSSSEGDIITVIYAYPMSSTKNEIQGCVMVNINEQSLNDYLVKFNSSMGELMILNSAGSIMSHSDKAGLYRNIKDEAFVKSILSGESPASFETEYKNKAYKVSFVRSKYYEDFIYVSLIPVELFYQKDYMIKKKIILLSLIILFSVLILSNFLSYKLYIPFRKILNKYKHIVTANDPGRSVNEYKLMDNIFGNMSSQINYLQSALEKNRELIRRNALNEILSSRSDSLEDVKGLKEMCGIAFDRKYFLQTIFTIGKPELYSSNKNILQLSKYSIIDYLGGITGGDCIFVPVDTDSKTVSVIVNTSINNTNGIREVIEKTEDFCFSKFNLYFMVAAGSFVEDISALPLSYDACKTALKYKFLFPASNTFYYEEIEKYEASKQVLPHEFIEKLNKLLNTNSYEKLEALMDTLRSTIEENTYSFIEVYNTAEKLCLALKQYAEGMDIRMEEAVEGAAMDSLIKPDNILEFIHAFLQAVRSIFDSINHKKLSKNFEIMEQVKKYVNDNLHREISLYTAANAVHISPNYLSRIFKEETGINYIDYVMKCKIDKAKELLQDTNLSIEEITRRIGYTYAAYFRNKFKELTGKTPNEYRVNVRDARSS